MFKRGLPRILLVLGVASILGAGLLGGAGVASAASKAQDHRTNSSTIVQLSNVLWD